MKLIIQYLELRFHFNMTQKWQGHEQCNTKKLAIFILRQVMGRSSASIARELDCSAKWITRVSHEVSDLIVFNSYDRALLFQMLSDLSVQFPDKACFSEYRMPMSRGTEIAIQNLRQAKSSADKMRAMFSNACDVAKY